MKPIVVSLDQNAASALASQRDADRGWAHLYDVLLSGVDTCLLVCPIPSETELETAPCTPERRRVIEDLLSKFSHGIRFKDYWELLKEETLAIVRTGVDLCPVKSPLVQGAGSPIVSGAEVKRLKRIMQLRLDGCDEPDGRDSFSVMRIREELAVSRCADFYRNLESLRQGAPLNPQNCMTAGICAYLLEKGITGDEIVALKTAVISHKWEAIPILYYHTMLSAQAQHDYLRGRAAEANDDIDRTRTAMALFVADYYLTESSVVELCKKIRTVSLTPTKVFAVRDRQAMAADLLSELEQHHDL